MSAWLMGHERDASSSSTPTEFLTSVLGIAVADYVMPSAMRTAMDAATDTGNMVGLVAITITTVLHALDFDAERNAVANAVAANNAMDNDEDVRSSLATGTATGQVAEPSPLSQQQPTTSPIVMLEPSVMDVLMAGYRIVLAKVDSDANSHIKPAARSRYAAMTAVQGLFNWLPSDKRAELEGRATDIVELVLSNAAAAPAPTGLQ
ncbi:MAG: hypothetical protein JO257_22755 [Deltaproteobacteria bacterium]|nr:hypothetical protein [Deltaproteobacteria bacterium]